MAKDSYWFRHDSSAGRDLKLLEITHIYTHWGKGVFWDVIEVLREQDGYKFDKTKTQILCSMIMCNDYVKFENWYKDCIRLCLFVEDKTHFWSESLIKRMDKWESSKLNGSKGGRPSEKPNRNPTHNPIETQHITQSKPKNNLPPNPIESIIEEYIIEDNNIKEDIINNKFNFKSSLLNLGVKENVIKDWLIVRTKKKAANTETAFNAIVKQIEKSGMTANDCIRIATEKSWAGFNNDWLKNTAPGVTDKAPENYSSNSLENYEFNKK